MSTSSHFLDLFRDGTDLKRAWNRPNWAKRQSNTGSSVQRQRGGGREKVRMGEEGSGARRILVQIPSAEEVERQSAGRAQPLNLFRPSSSSSASTSAAGGGNFAGAGGTGQGQQGSTFTEAFSFLRNTEFYSPPPAAARPAPAPAPRPSQPKPPSHPSSSTTAGAAGGGGGGLSSVPGNFRKEEVYAAAAQTGQSRNSILVSKRQQGNSVLKHIRNARWMFSDIVPDYILGQNTCALYLSLRYHLLHPEYIYFRIRELQKSFRLRVVLCHVDVDDVIKPLHEVTKTCLLHDCSLLCAWSQEECARYLETIKIYENKPADYIQERTDNDYLSRLTNSLTTVRHVNKTDVLTLGSTFKTLSAIMNASMDDLARCPGIGERKVKRLYDAFNEPFRRVPTAKRPQQSSGDKSASAVDDRQAHSTTEGEGLAGGNAVGETGTNIQEAIPATKLINREDETSVREALKAVRGKSSKRTSKLQARSASVPTREEIVDLQPPIISKGPINPPPESIQEEYVISLDD